MITNENLKDIIYFQKKFRFILHELKTLSNQLDFLKLTLKNMVNNLVHLNNFKLFDNVKNGYIVLLNELKEIKNKMDILPNEINFSNLKGTTLNNISVKDVRATEKKT